MQTRDYDDYIYIESIKGFRQVINGHKEIDVNKETNGYCNMYADSIAVSYLHSMNKEQLNAIHYFEDNHEVIFKVLTEELTKKYKNPKLELGFVSVNILDEYKDEYCNTAYTFIDASGNKFKIKMYKSVID